MPSFLPFHIENFKQPLSRHLAIKWLAIFQDGSHFLAIYLAIS